MQDKATLIADFIERQYVLDQGDVRDNVERLFAADLVYHAGDEVLDREDLIAMGETVRRIPRAERSITASDFRCDGDVVRWRLVARLPGMGPDSSDAVQRSDVTAVFGPDGLVVEIRSADAA